RPVGRARPVDIGHPVAEVVGEVADRVELGVAGLAAGVEVGELGDRAATEDADPEQAVLLPDHDTTPGYRCPRAARSACRRFRSARAASAVRCSSSGLSRRSPERWTSRACVIASAPIFGSYFPWAFLIELIAEPARNRMFEVRPLASASIRLRMMF